MEFSKRIRVANIIEEAKVGGPQKRLLQVAKLLTPFFETTVILPKENSEDLTELCKSFQINFKKFSITRITKDWMILFKYILFSPFEIFVLATYFRKKKFSIIHVSGGCWQYKGALAGRLAGIKVIWNLNDTYSPFLLRFIFEILSPIAFAFVHTSHRTMEYYSKHIRSKSSQFIIPPPVDSNYFNPKLVFKESHNFFNKFEGKKIIGSVANISRVKGIETLIESSSLLNKEFTNLIFLIVGPIFENQISYYKKLLNLIKMYDLENFFFIGGFKDVRPVLKKIDIFVCSSVSESGPMTLFEAMSMGKPIVSTNVGDVHKYITECKNGFIVDIGDSKKISDKIKLILNLDKDELEKFGKYSRQIVKEKLDVKICSQKYKEVYNLCLNKS